MGDGMMSDIKRRKKIMAMAYTLGYNVGLHSHAEWMPWIVDLRKSLLQMAKEEGILKVVRKAYEMGKSNGATMREKLITEGVYTENSRDKGRLTLIHLPREAQVRTDGLETFMMEGEREFPQILHWPSVTLPPRLIKDHRGLRKPMFLEVPPFLRP